MGGQWTAGPAVSEPLAWNGSGCRAGSGLVRFNREELGSDGERSRAPHIAQWVTPYLPP